MGVRTVVEEIVLVDVVELVQMAVVVIAKEDVGPDVLDLVV